MKVIALKLVTGEEVIGKVEDHVVLESSRITLKDPLMIALQRAPSGDVGVGLLPFMPYLDGKGVTFKPEHVLCMEEVDEKFKTQYNSIFSGIVTPPTKKLLLTS